MQRIIPIVCGFLVMFIASSQAWAVQPETRPRERTPEIDAKCWFNAQPVRLYDHPELILLEFWSVRSRESREFVDTLSALRRVYHDGRLLVVGLTADPCKDAAGFIQRKKIEYKVGAESRSPKDYGAEELPTVVLVDSKARRIVARWSGREVKGKTIAKAIREFLGPPGAGGDSGALPPEQRALLLETISVANVGLAGLTEQILAADGEIGPEGLSALERFYEDNLPEDPSEDNAVTRGQGVARSAIMGSEEAGYKKLLASGRLSEAAKTAMRDRVLEIAENDPSGGVRVSAIGALRTSIGRPGDAVLLDTLRGLYDREPSPFVRASIDHALEDLDPAQAGNREDLTARPIALNLRRLLKESPDPASSPWADAHAYKQTAPQRTTEQLLDDYWSFPDPPDDEIGRQNATLKREAALGEIEGRIGDGEIRDLRLVKYHLARALSEEPDPFIRKWAVWSGLRTIANRGDSALRAEIVDLLEKRLAVEPHRHVRAPLEATLKELKGR